MADRYWVGGAGTWDTTTTTGWSATSGGAGGASAPTSADNAIFDANSGLTVGLSVTITGGVCANLTYTPATAMTIGRVNFVIVSSLTVAGTFSTSGTAGNNRLRIKSLTLGIATSFVVATAGSISDIDFYEIIVSGAAAPISGTRLGNVVSVQGVTFAAPKNVYWNLAGAQNWSANGWAATSGGTPNTDYFPLVQDTAVFDNAGSVTGSIAMDTAAFQYFGNVDMSARTSAMTLTSSGGIFLFGNWTNGSGTGVSSLSAMQWYGRGTQTLISAGKTWPSVFIVLSYGGTFALGDALNIGANALTVTSGNFVTNGYAVTASQISSNTAGPRSISLGSSTVTLSSTGTPIILSTNNGLAFNAETSTIIFTATSLTSIDIGYAYYNVTLPNYNTILTLTSSNTFNNLIFSIVINSLVLQADQIINGNLSLYGSTSTSNRTTIKSNTPGTNRNITINSAVTLTDIDFQDIIIAGIASPISGTRLGDVGNNLGITFTSKTVYWNLAGAQNWSANGWAATSGGTPSVVNFPLTQDTAVFDNVGSVTGIISINADYTLPTIDMSARTTAMTLSSTVAARVYGDWINGSGITLSGTGILTFSKRTGTQTITSAGKTFTCGITVNTLTGTVQLEGALSSNASAGLTITSGTFNAVSYNVTTNAVQSGGTITRTINMGSGLWTHSSSGGVWNVIATGLTINQGTADILLSNTQTTAKTFAGAGFSYNKLTIGGSGISTTTFSGANTFTELASTKTVAHTVALSTTAQTFGKWTITGTVGNVVTVTGAGSHIIAGPRVAGVDYLALGTTSFVYTSSGEFYAGVNSTGTGVGVILTAAPAAVTRYWVGGTGVLDITTTTNWSDTSGGVGGFSVPVSVDTVIFDTLSSSTAYTVTFTPVGNSNFRFSSLTMGAPMSGNITWAGTALITAHSAINLTGGSSRITRTYTGNILLGGASTGTLTTNGVSLASTSGITCTGIGSSWSLESALTLATSPLTISRGSFDTAGYALTVNTINLIGQAPRALLLGASTVSIASATPLSLTTTGSTLNAGTSTISLTNAAPAFTGAGFTYYNVTYTVANTTGLNVTGANTFNNLTFTGGTTGVKIVSFAADQTFTGALTTTGTTAIARITVSSDIVGTARTFTTNSTASISDIDFQDIAVVGTAAPISGTRLGDLGGNSGITLTAKTVYWNLAGAQNWNATGWAATSGGSPAISNFPLAQDIAVFDNTGSVTGTIAFVTGYAYPTIDMRARTAAMTLATVASAIYGDWINGSGTTLSGTATLTFAKRGTQTITPAGKPFTQSININSINGTVRLLADTVSNRTGAGAIVLTNGTLDLNGYTLYQNSTGGSFITAAGTKTLLFNGGTVSIFSALTIGFNNAAPTGLTVLAGSAPGTIVCTFGTTTFAGGGSVWPCTLRKTASGTFTITGNNTFLGIDSTYIGASTIALGSTIQTVGTWTAAGTAGNLLTVSGASAAAPAYLVLTGVSPVNVDYLNISNVRVTPLSNKWYAGANSINNGSLGWIFTTAVIVASVVSTFFLMF